MSGRAQWFAALRRFKSFWRPRGNFLVLPPVLIDKRRPGKGARCPQRGRCPSAILVGPFAEIAQREERLICNQQGRGSRPRFSSRTAAGKTVAEKNITERGHQHMKRNKDLRKFFGKKLKDTVTGVVGTCTGSANYLGGDDMVLLAYRDSTGAANEGWYLFGRCEVLG